ncbi:hypothetical protein BFV94_3006 [Alteromonas macleodii]|uniref:Uncharacterized protein n=2 Tax=Alteromonas macleodii TaxID=28108 RepID=A0AB36FPW2_ALTMA|nr:hypothetical protein BFV93_2994 [Alteromonas macleodii]OES30140.1 hypothetical protein BFV94_3006 [Alteromonas macleodii]OES30468.1 hypothetical protein BFV95_3006 [Alteromonas macleodii]OES40677.1 hypothetical protein BFV96_2991 [Alteromonas macleodii]
MLVAYFSKHICPDRFSLTNEEAKKNDFYEVHIYVPDASNNEIAKIPRENYGALSIKCEFMPIKNASRWGDILAGKIRNTGSVEFSEGLLSSDYLRYSKIDVNYYFGYWNFREQDCSISTLIYLFILRSVKLVYLSIIKYSLVRYFRKLRSRQKLRSPLKSKYEIYEALMNNDNVLSNGSFTKSELSNALFGKHYVGEYLVYKKVSKSLNWILDACIDDGEMRKVGNQEDPLYEIKGKGIHYFTLTKEHLKNEEANKLIQRQQISIQKRMVWLTVFLVIGTFLSAIDKSEQIITFMTGFMVWFNSLI